MDKVAKASVPIADLHGGSIKSLLWERSDRLGRVTAPPASDRPTADDEILAILIGADPYKLPMGE